ncbi:hypothetical protein V495_01325 [Pseudogymnoascus sp. VKM F-4514 (FW-929)]|nr:hypothetical protein V495_01325 [Pseudogymnoascus sp. VKM F-4514 (FW-929)]KFY68012.1 hypothetical protein V497_00050 [Pseudogymnoascus sp. VKM F-4516 (FW-969)]
MSDHTPLSALVAQRPTMGSSIAPSAFIALPVVPGYVPPELFTDFPPNAPAFFSTSFGSRAVRLVPNPAPQYAVRTNDPNDIYERANFYRDKYPEFVHSIQSLPIAWEDLYTYFDPLDIWVEGAGFCFHVIHRIAAINIEKRNQIELYVDEWAKDNLAKLARVPPDTPVIAVFELEDYQHFDIENLHSFETVDIFNILAQQCYALQPTLQRIRQAITRNLEVDSQPFAPIVTSRSGTKIQHQVPWQESPNSKVIGLGIATTKECAGGYHRHQREASIEKNRGVVRSQAGSQTKIEAIYTHNPRTSQNGPVALTGPVLTAFTPRRDFKDRSFPSNNGKNRAISGLNPGANRHRAQSSADRKQIYTAVRYDAAACVAEKTAIPRNTTDYTNTVKIEEGRSIYIRGFTIDELASDFIPTLMECCGEIEGYKPMNDFAFLTFKTPRSALEAIRRFDGIYDDRPLKVAPYKRKSEFDHSNGPWPNRHRGNSFGSSQLYTNGYTGDSLKSGEHRPHYNTTGRDRNASVSNNGPQLPRKESNPASKRHNTSSKHDTATKKAHAEGVSVTTPRGGKGHRSTSSGQSAKTAKPVDTDKLRSDSSPAISTKKGSFAISEDLSVPDEGKCGTSFSSYSSSFTHKESIFDEPPAGTPFDLTTKDTESSFSNKECSVTSAIISASPECREYNTATGDSSRLEKKMTKKLKRINFNAVPTGSTEDCQSIRKLAGGAVNAEAFKPDGMFDANDDAAAISSNPLESDSKANDKASPPTWPTSSKGLTGVGQFEARPYLKRSTKVIHGSPRKLTTDEGSPRSSKKKHGKTDSNTSSFGIETKAKKYEGYELSKNETSDNLGEASRPEPRNHAKSNLGKRRKSNIDLKENTLSERAPSTTDINILADPTNWPSLGEGKSTCRTDQNTAGQTLTTLLNPALGGCLVAARRNSMAAIISQKTRIVPAVPLLLRSVTMTEPRSVSADSTKSDSTIINVASTAGTRLWPTVVKWDGKPPSAEGYGLTNSDICALSTSGAGGKDWLHGYNGTTLKRGRRKWRQECNPNVILALSHKKASYFPHISPTPPGDCFCFCCLFIKAFLWEAGPKALYKSIAHIPIFIDPRPIPIMVRHLSRLLAVAALGIIPHVTACDECYGPTDFITHERIVRRMQPDAQGAAYGPTRELEWGQINFLQTTDTHGWLEGHIKEQNYGADWGDFVSFTRQMKAKATELNVDLLLIDTGDLHDGNGMSDATSPNGAASNPIFEEIPYDLLTIGNHELYISDIAYETFSDFSTYYGDRYVTSNVQIFNQKSNKYEYAGAKYRYFTTDHGIRIMAFGVLFDFTGNSNASIVTPAAEMVKQEWFINALHTKNPIDMFLVIGHNAIQGSTSTTGTVLDAIRAVHPEKFIQVFGGHTHIRDAVIYDHAAVGMESGRYCETVGWMAVSGLKSKNYYGAKLPEGVPHPTKTAYDKPVTTSTATASPKTSTAAAKRGAQVAPGRPVKHVKPIHHGNSGYRFARRYLDWNRLTFAFHAENSQNKPFDLDKGVAVTQHITETRKKLNLTSVYGCAPQTWCMSCQPFGSPGNIYTLLTKALATVIVNPDRSKTPRIIIANTGSVRFDLVQGPFTYDDSFIVSPFTNTFQYLADVPWSVASQLLDALNRGGYQKRSEERGADFSFQFPTRDNTEACLDPGTISPEVAKRSTRGIVRRQSSTLTPGYNTTDDFGNDGDDTKHSGIPYFPQPNDFQANASFPADGSAPETVDVVFFDFIGSSYVIPALQKIPGGEKFTKADIKDYLPKTFVSNQYLPEYAKSALDWQKDMPNCPVGKGVGFAK